MHRNGRLYRLAPCWIGSTRRRGTRRGQNNQREPRADYAQHEHVQLQSAHHPRRRHRLAGDVHDGCAMAITTYVTITNAGAILDEVDYGVELREQKVNGGQVSRHLPAKGLRRESATRQTKRQGVPLGWRRRIQLLRQRFHLRWSQRRLYFRRRRPRQQPGHHHRHRDKLQRRVSEGWRRCRQPRHPDDHHGRTMGRLHASSAAGGGNDGAISETNAEAIHFGQRGTAASSTLSAGAVDDGVVRRGAGADTPVPRREIQGSISGIGSRFTGFELVDVQAPWLATGSNILTAPTKLQLEPTATLKVGGTGRLEIRIGVNASSLPRRRRSRFEVDSCGVRRPAR